MNTCFVIIATTSSIFWAADLNLTPESEKQTVIELLAQLKVRLGFLFGYY